MNGRLHFLLSFGMCAAAAIAVVLVLTSGWAWAATVVCALAYGLGVLSHRTLFHLAVEGDKPGWQHWAVSAIWPLFGVWLVVWLILPAPREEGDDPRRPKEAGR